MKYIYIAYNVIWEHCGFEPKFVRCYSRVGQCTPDSYLQEELQFTFITSEDLDVHIQHKLKKQLSNLNQGKQIMMPEKHGPRNQLDAFLLTQSFICLIPKHPSILR